MAWSSTRVSSRSSAAQDRPDPLAHHRRFQRVPGFPSSPGSSVSQLMDRVLQEVVNTVEVIQQHLVGRAGRATARLSEKSTSPLAARSSVTNSSSSRRRVCPRGVPVERGYPGIGTFPSPMAQSMRHCGVDQDSWHACVGSDRDQAVAVPATYPVSQCPGFGRNQVVRIGRAPRPAGIRVRQRR